MPTEERGQIAPSPKKAKKKRLRRTAEAVQNAEESVVTQQKNQPGKTSAATLGEGSSASAAAPRPRYPPYPTSGKVKDLRKWYKECDKIGEMINKGTTKAVQSPKDKVVVLRAARSIVSVSRIMDDGQRLP